MTWYISGAIRFTLGCRTICVVLMLGDEELNRPFSAGSSLERTMEAAVAILCRWFEQHDSGSAFLADREALVFPSRPALELRPNKVDLHRMNLGLLREAT